MLCSGYCICFCALKHAIEIELSVWSQSYFLFQAHNFAAIDRIRMILITRTYCLVFCLFISKYFAVFIFYIPDCPSCPAFLILTGDWSHCDVRKSYFINNALKLPLSISQHQISSKAPRVMMSDSLTGFYKLCQLKYYVISNSTAYNNTSNKLK